MGQRSWISADGEARLSGNLPALLISLFALFCPEIRGTFPCKPLPSTDLANGERQEGPADWTWQPGGRLANAAGLACIFHHLIRDLGHLHGCPRNWVINTFLLLQWNEKELFILLIFKTILNLVRGMKIFVGISNDLVPVFHVSSNKQILKCNERDCEWFGGEIVVFLYNL